MYRISASYNCTKPVTAERGSVIYMTAAPAAAVVHGIAAPPVTEISVLKARNSLQASSHTSLHIVCIKIIGIIFTCSLV